MSALIGQLAFWALLVFLSVGAAFVLLAAIRWIAGREARLLDKALHDKDEQKRREGSGEG
jgi:hypothetical protein